MYVVVYMHTLWRRVGAGSAVVHWRESRAPTTTASQRRLFASRSAQKLPRAIPLCAGAPWCHLLATATSPPSVPAFPSRALVPPNQQPTLPQMPALPSRSLEPPGRQPTLPQMRAPTPACPSPALILQLPPRSGPVFTQLSLTRSCLCPPLPIALTIFALVQLPSLCRLLASSCAGTLPRTVAAAALCLCLSPGYDGVHMVHPLAWPTQLLGSPASPQRAGRWSPWTPEKGR